MKTGMFVVNESLYTVGGRLCVPTGMWKALLSEFHESDVAGHRSAKQMSILMERRMYWPGMKRDIEDYTARCETCGDNKTYMGLHLGKLRPHLPPRRRPMAGREPDIG